MGRSMNAESSTAEAPEVVKILSRLRLPVTWEYLPSQGSAIKVQTEVREGCTATLIAWPHGWASVFVESPSGTELLQKDLNGCQAITLAWNLLDIRDTWTFTEELHDALTEEELAEWLALALRALGIAAEASSTGGGCFSTCVPIPGHHFGGTGDDDGRLEVTTASGECFSWSLYHPNGDGQHVLTGHWDTFRPSKAAKRVKKLLEGLGEDHW